MGPDAAVLMNARADRHWRIACQWSQGELCHDRRRRTTHMVPISSRLSGSAAAAGGRAPADSELAKPLQAPRLFR